MTGFKICLRCFSLTAEAKVLYNYIKRESGILHFSIPAIHWKGERPMTKKYIRIIPFFLLLLCLCGCGGKDKYLPLPPLSRETVSPEREAALQAALNGSLPTATPEKILKAAEATPVVPTFDENSFFAEVDPIATEENPFVIEDTATPTPVIPTATPLPTATKPYDPNIMMYGTSNGLTTYTMQPGDFLICIGRRFNVSLGHLMAQNGISAPDELGVGDTVLLPRNPSPMTSPTRSSRRRERRTSSPRR